MEKIQEIESVLEQAFQFNAFGPHMQYRSFKYQGSPNSVDDRLISQDVTGTVVYTDDKGAEKSETLVVKTINEKCPYPFKHLAFLGEISVRRRIIPYLEKYSPGISSRFAEFCYGSVSSTVENDDALIILKNLPHVESSPRLWDRRHLFVVLKFLAEFHAASYKAKSKDADVFLPMLRRLHEIDFSQNEDAECTPRLANLVPELDTPEKYLKSILSEKNEPVSVINVGIMATPQTVFRYDGKGDPVDVKVHELFGCRYAPPAFDLMNVMYLFVNEETRTKYWNEALKFYYDVLVEAVGDDQAPAFQRIRHDFKDYSLVAYSTAPVVLSPYFDDELLNVFLNDIENFILSKNAEE